MMYDDDEGPTDWRTDGSIQHIGQVGIFAACLVGWWIFCHLIGVA